MHDYHKAKELVEYAIEKAQERGAESVKKITVSMGNSSGYSGDSVIMYFKEASEGTICEDAELVIKPIKSMLECPACGTVFPRKLLDYKCPMCGVEGVPSKIGTEVIIEDVET
jgi:hydrogenase nickel incorporation protein HypA/HybF